MFLVIGSFPFYFSGGSLSLGPQFIGTENFYLNMFSCFIGDLLGYTIMSKYSYKVKRIKFLTSVMIGYFFVGVFLIIIKITG